MFLEYLRRFVYDWVALLAGGGSVILAFLPLLGIIESVPAWAQRALAAVLYLFASYRIWRREHEALLAEQARNEPTLVLDFKHDGGSYLERRTTSYYNSGNLSDLYRVRVTNSGVSTIRNVKAVIEALEPKYVERLPLDLLIMDSHSRDLAPKGEIYFDVAFFDPDARHGRITLCKANAGYSPITIPAQRYLLTIKVTGDNVNSITKSFSIHTTASRLFMTEHSGPPALPPQNSSV